MTYELDHIFILTDRNAPAGDQLVQAGITEGSPNIHTGQGTTNRRFFFDNSMVELLWVHNIAEAQSQLTQPTYLLPRWQGRDKNASPFGICFRPIADEKSPPFLSWDYKPQYLPTGHAIQIANTVNQLKEPFLFFASWVNAPQGKTDHPAGLKNITHVQITHPYPDLQSPSIDAISHLITFTSGDRYLLTLTFDNHRQGKILDFSPDLPLILHY